MKKYRLLYVVVILAIICAGIFLWINRERLFNHKPKAFTLYGNVDDREVNLAFQLPERIKSIEVDEGSTVKKGQLLATLETDRILNSLASAQAALDEARANLLKLKNGSRKEDINIARAEVEAAKANLIKAQKDHNRHQKLEETSSVSIKNAEKAEADYLIAKSLLSVAENNLEKLLAGSRKEEIEMGEAQFVNAKAQLAIQEQMLKDANLYSPCDGIVRKRLMEVGEMAAPQTPVLTIAQTSPKWVRAYLPETMLTKIKYGDKAFVEVDSMPKEHFEGWVGFISPSAEFTPKNVETPELRASLVYEVRILLKDPKDLLKLGSPATVIFPEAAAD